MNLLLFNLATDIDDPILGFTTSWIRALAARVDTINVITMRAGRIEVPENVRVYSVGKEKGYGEVRRALELYKHLFGILKKADIDACFSHMSPIFTVLAGPVLAVKGIPVITWYAHKNVTVLLKLAYLFSRTMVSVNGQSYRYRRNKFVATGHGIDTNLFSPGQPPEAEPPLVLTVGRMSPVKGLMTLVSAIRIIREKNSALQAAIVGSPMPGGEAYAESIKKAVREMGLKDAIHFEAGVPQNGAVAWYRKCAMHVNCAPADNAVDKAVLEAMACERPSLTSAKSFISTMGKWADTLFFKCGDAEDLAEKIITVLGMPQALRKEMEKDLRKSVVENHSLEKLSAKIVALLEDKKSHLFHY